MEPVIMALKDKYGDKVKFIVADVDDPQGRKLAEKYLVDSIPTFRFINGQGKLVDSYTGVTDEGTLGKYVEKVIQ